MIKKFVVILLLFSFALQIFPERVFAANYLLLSSDSLNRSSWTLNPGVAFGGQNNQRVVTQAITSGSTSIVAKWSSSITGEYKNSNTSQPGWWLLRLQEYSENGVSPSGFRNTDFYLEIRPNGASATSVPTPLTERTVEALVYKVGGVNSVPGIIATDDFVDSSNGTTSFFNVARGKYPWASGTPQTTYEKYISDTAMYLFSGNHPKLSIGSLPSAAIAACGTGTVKQDHLSNWALMDAITKTGSEFQTQVVAAIKSAGGNTPGAKPLDTSPFRDNAQDDILYHKYYSSMNFGDAGFYPDKVPNSGDALDAQYAESYASIWTWTPSDYQNIPGTNITIWGAVAGVLGVAGVNAAVTDVTSSIALTKAKIGQKVAVKIAAKSAAAKAFVPTVGGTTEVEAIQGVALASGEAGLSTAASAIIRANLLAMIGTAAVLGAIKGVQWYTAAQNDAYYKSIWELTLATAYQAKEMEYFECVRKQVDNGTITEAQASAAGFGSAEFAAAQKIVARMTAAAVSANANGAGLKAKNDAADPHGCPSISISALMDWSVCQIAATVFEIMKWFVNISNNLAKSAMGLEEGTAANTTQSGPPVVGTVSVASSLPQTAGRTGTRDVVITLNSPNSNQMAFSEDGKTWGQWETYSSTKKYQLGTATNGKHDVYVKFKNASGESQPISTSIIMEVVPINTTGPNASGSAINAAGY